MVARCTWIASLGIGVGVSVLALVLTAEARKPKVGLLGSTTLDRQDGRVGRLTPPKRFGRGSEHGGTIVADATGLWIVERNAGALIRADHAGEVRATLPLHEGLGELVHDAASRSLFVADRQADRVLRYATSGDEATLVAEATITEPHGLALTPDGSTLLVTSVANHELVAVEVATMQVRWRAKLGPEPRAVAVSPDGRFAIVGFLSRGAVARVELASEGKQVRWHPLSPRDPVEIEVDEDDWGESSPTANIVEAASRFDVPKDSGRRHARNVFALAFVGEGIVVAPHHVATPQMELRPAADRSDAYGGGAAEISPIEYRFARIAEPGPDGLTAIDQHDLSVHQPRAIAYDRGRDVLYIGGYGDDEIVAIASASREHPSLAWRATLASGSACGLDGLAVLEQDGPEYLDRAGPGESLWAHCELTRSVVRIDIDLDSASGQPVKERKWVVGPELAKSLRSAAVERGAEVFRRGEDWMLGEALACASCHPEGRNDGLSWRLGRSILQTPILAGRLDGTSPYKWTGEDPTLLASFTHTLERIGGDPESLEGSELRDLQAYLTSLARPRPPSGLDEAALARGKVVFEAECSICHEGEASTDRERHEFATTMRRVDTPSLIGLAHSAPYYHDGSAIDLATLLDDRGSIHDMIDSSGLSPEQRRDLTVYLLSL